MHKSRSIKRTRRDSHWLPLAPEQRKTEELSSDEKFHRAEELLKEYLGSKCKEEEKHFDKYFIPPPLTSIYYSDANEQKYCRTPSPLVENPHPPEHIALVISEEDSSSSRSNYTYDKSGSLLAIALDLFKSIVRLSFRTGRAMLDLVGIEPEPGPKAKGKKVVIQLPGIKSSSERHPGLLYCDTMVQKQKKKKKSKNSLVSSASNRNTGGQISASSFDMKMYRDVLDNPFDRIPVRLGGETMIPSGIATLVSRFPVGVSATGVLSIVAYPISGGVGGNYFLTSVSSAAPYSYGNPAGSNFPGGAALAQLSAEGRIIAAGLRIFSLASSTNNQGSITVGCVPRDVSSNSVFISASGFPIATTTVATQGLNEFQDYLSTETYPLKDGCTVVYRPQDPVDFTFRGLVNGVNSISALGAGAQIVPFFVVGINGAANSSVVWCEMVTHIEYTVGTGTAGIINTGLGNMNSVDSFSVAKGLFGSIYDTTMSGVVGGLSSGATMLGRSIGNKIAAGMSGSYMSSRVN